MQRLELTYGNEGFKEISDFLKDNCHKDYSLSIFDINQSSTIDIECDFVDMVTVISFVSSIEHDFPAWIDIDELSNSYIVGLEFTRGSLSSGSYIWKNNTLMKED